MTSPSFWLAPAAAALNDIPLGLHLMLE